MAISHHSSQLRLIPYLHHIEGEKRTRPRFADCISHVISDLVLDTKQERQLLVHSEEKFRKAKIKSKAWTTQIYQLH